MNPLLDRRDAIAIDQALHGYQHGHRLLASSIQLDPDAEAMLLAMSDLLTSQRLSPTDSYLSGYPLKSAHKYVLARTWPAPESPRLGSVWTHSLLLDYSTLAVLDDPTSLLSLFERPASESLNRYSHRLALKKNKRQAMDDFNSHYLYDSRAEVALRMLYGHGAKKRVILPELDPLKDERLAISLWRQMWPNLRRNFAFFSRANQDINEISAACILSFNTGQHAQIEPELAFDQINDPDAEGIRLLIKDLPRRGPTRLRRFLGRYAFDAPSARKLVPALATICAERRDAVSALLSFERLLGESPGLKRLKHDILIESARNSADLEAFARSLELFAEEPAFSSIAKLNEMLHPSDALDLQANRILSTAANSVPGSVGDQVFEVVAANVSAKALARLSPKVKWRILDVRPDVVQEAEYWNESRNDRAFLAKRAIEVDCHVSAMLQGIGERITPEIAGYLLDDAKNFLDIYRAATVSSFKDEIIGLAATRPGFVSALSKSTSPIALSTLEQVAASLLQQDQMPLPSSTTILDLVERSDGRPTSGQPHIVTLGIVAASKSHTGDSLFLELFDPAYQAASKYRLPSTCQAFLCRELTVQRKSFFVPDLLLEAALLKFGSTSKVFSVSRDPGTIAEIARYIRKIEGVSSLERIMSSLEKSDEKSFPLPKTAVLNAVKSAMPLFSASRKPSTKR